MNYELAKQLKDLGFPQHLERGKLVFTDDGEIIKSSDYSLVPTLEELIEACGEEFHGLRKGKDEWFADARKPFVKPYKGKRWKLTRSDKTPKEAVAKLWIALQT